MRKVLVLQTIGDKIFVKAQKSSNTEEDQKTLISAFA